MEQRWNNNNNVNKAIKGIKDNQVNKVIKDKQDINDNHGINEMNEKKGEKEGKEKQQQSSSALNISSSVDIGPGGGRTVVGGRSLSFQEKLKRVKESYEYAIGTVDESISKSLEGFITLYKDYRLINEAMKELVQTAPRNASVNNIPAIIGKWKENGIYTYEQLIANQESNSLIKSSP